MEDVCLPAAAGWKMGKNSLKYFDLPTSSLPAVGRAGIINKYIVHNTIGC
ncbi:MAG: hypothetical protein Q8M94_11910 [Ignavibacteria bacterium]|nr:hypothetical protein [Ignavibacteria bacterium]